MKYNYGALTLAEWSRAAWEFNYRLLAGSFLDVFTTFSYPPYVVEPAHALSASTLGRSAGTLFFGSYLRQKAGAACHFA